MEQSLFFIKGEINKWYKYYKSDFTDKELIYYINKAIKLALALDINFCNNIIRLTDLYLYDKVEIKQCDENICKVILFQLDDDLELSVGCIVESFKERYDKDILKYFTDDVILNILDRLQEKGILFRIIGFLKYCDNMK